MAKHDSAFDFFPLELFFHKTASEISSAYVSINMIIVLGLIPVLDSPNEKNANIIPCYSLSQSDSVQKTGSLGSTNWMYFRSIIFTLWCGKYRTASAPLVYYSL